MKSWVLVLAACGGHDVDTADHAAPAATTAPAQAGLIEIAPDMMRDLRVTFGQAQARAGGETVAALGELRVDEDAYAEVASPVAARVARVVARPGDRVAAGQVLAVLASPELAQARAELDAAQARLEIARRAAERKRALVADRVAPEREQLEADAALADAEAAHRIAAAGLRKYGAAAGAAELAITSPLAGTVIDRSVVRGQLADPAKTLFRIGDLSTLWLFAHVYERDAVRVVPAGTAVATFAALPGVRVDAAIKAVAREVDPASRTIAIRLDVPNPDGALRPGMSATVAIPLGAATGSPVVTVPAAAVQRVGTGWAVFLPRGAAAFEARAIGRGRDLAGEVEVVSGLRAGDRVVVDGAFLLKAEADKARGAGHED